MKVFRSIHLYLGCIFAPLLLFFAVSGIWQTLGMQSPTLDLLSTVHTSKNPKVGEGLSSALLRLFVLVMSVSFILSTVLGIVMAFKFSRSQKVVIGCLLFGIAFPVIAIVIRVLG